MLAQRLYLRIWLAVVAAIVLLSALVGWVWREQQHEAWERQREAWRERQIILRDADGQMLGSAPLRRLRDEPGAPEEEGDDAAKRGPVVLVPLQDGRTVQVELPRLRRPDADRHGFGRGARPTSWGLPAPWGFLGTLAVVAAAVALGAYPFVRRLTTRLEALQRGVERWGNGDLSTRMEVRGEDEVAFLAERFNVAAERVQQLLSAHKALLANASHELRSPLARIRIGLTLWQEAGDPDTAAQRRQEIERNLQELDQLIEEILLASRLDLTDGDGLSSLGPTELVDLLGLAAEEAARVGADLQLSGREAANFWQVQGNARLLRRALRNLLENAQRHGAREGANQPIEIGLGRQADGAIAVTVGDRGPGVPQAWREKIFEPFARLPGASEREGGVGLGLSLVRAIARRHGGDAHCTERQGGGACFVLTLPANKSGDPPRP